MVKRYRLVDTAACSGDGSEVAPRVFSVPIAETPLWKIRAIAEFKARSRRGVPGADSRPGGVAASSLARHTELACTSASVLCRPEFSAYPFTDPQSRMQYQTALEKRAHEIRKEMSAMNSARLSLLWLLKKAVQYETKRNHNP